MNENGGIEEEDHDMEIQQYCDAPTTRSAWLKLETARACYQVENNNKISLELKLHYKKSR